MTRTRLTVVGKKARSYMCVSLSFLEAIDNVYKVFVTVKENALK